MAENASRSIKVFLSYAHEDEAFQEEFSAHLGALKCQGIVEVWWDGQIDPGSEWNAEIARKWEAADLIVLLVSSAFLNSVYCYDKEMRRAVERHEAGLARVVPIIVRDCYWQSAPFAKLQGLPKEMKPITARPKQRRDAVWAEVASSIHQAAVEISKSLPQKSRPKQVNVSVEQGDIISKCGDVLALKYAQALYGVDAYIVDYLEKFGIHVIQHLPEPNSHCIIDSQGAIGAKSVLFVGIDQLYHFRYGQIRDFARKILVTLATEAPSTRHLLITLHGAGYGLDEAEAYESEIAGFVDAISAHQYPENLTDITTVEKDSRRATRLNKILSHILPIQAIPISGLELGSLNEATGNRLQSVGYDSSKKAHIFVAMPFSEDMEDTYYYGIQAAANAAGFLCERADLSSFTGDVIVWVKERIKSSSLVLADLTSANPNVYLEVGYAWGLNRPTILIAKNVDELKFDVKGQRCLIYRNIRELENLLSLELRNLRDMSRAHV